MNRHQPISKFLASLTRTRGSGVLKKSASFVGFTPAAAPRFLAVCVLRKDDVDDFYGGTYAAPAAARLLLGALDRADQQPLVRRVRTFTHGSMNKGEEQR